MPLSTLFIAIGILTTFVGFLLVLLSLRASPEEVKHRKTGIIFIGPIPIILDGNRRWITLSLLLAIIIVFVIIELYQPSLIGW